MSKYSMLLGFLIAVISLSPIVLAQGSHEIDHIETGENIRTIYYNDGTKEMFITAFVTVTLSSSVSSEITMLPTSSPFGFIGTVIQILKIVFLSILPEIVWKFIDFLCRLPWWIKHRKSKTPVVIL